MPEGQGCHQQEPPVQGFSCGCWQQQHGCKLTHRPSTPPYNPHLQWHHHSAKDLRVARIGLQDGGFLQAHSRTHTHILVCNRAHQCIGPHIVPPLSIYMHKEAGNVHAGPLASPMAPLLTLSETMSVLMVYRGLDAVGLYCSPSMATSCSTAPRQHTAGRVARLGVPLCCCCTAHTPRPCRRSAGSYPLCCPALPCPPAPPRLVLRRAPLLPR